jgi:hypothetical protein
VQLLFFQLAGMKSSDRLWTVQELKEWHLPLRLVKDRQTFLTSGNSD